MYTMNKKVGILSLYHNSTNYGGMLQSYALTNCLIQYGISTKQISYRLETGYPNYKEDSYRELKEFGKRLIYGSYYSKCVLRRKKIHRFEESIPHTEEVTYETISELNDYFDMFICGSDQIWNPVGWQPTLFLDFVTKGRKKIAYAASVARGELSEQEIKVFEKYLPSFSAISVREEHIANFLNGRYPCLQIKTMPDPVFLLECKAWKKLFSEEKREKYALAYFLGQNVDNRDMAMRYAKEQGVNLYFIGYLDRTNFIWEKKHENLLLPPLGVEEFLAYVYNAEFVLTDSFHAAAFSIIFETPFYALPRFDDADRNSMNSRIENLVKEFRVEARYKKFLTGGDVEKYQWNDCELDNIRTIKREKRRQGVEYLIGAINAE